MSNVTFRLILTVAIFIFSYSVYSVERVEIEKQKSDSTINISEADMNNYISIFEIPATDISRAIEFYQAILEINIEKMEFPDMEMGLLPYEEQAVTGVIVKRAGFRPSENGVTIYLNGGDNLQIILDRVAKNSGKIIVPKTAHADEIGYFAIFLDSEGNKLGLHSPN
ncbi:VOC family protein [Vibrio sp. ZSDE26]|uniref:VOC family protein n=1 Tax=Vibrio amylolyticus TaxID=2847292 RepID=A0A9X1XKH2_9VIBR|nr:VOC family protein [Vibrio amylolyticus]MCK6264509.1 VOC family protein [Vibrio amylolyticus]